MQNDFRNFDTEMNQIFTLNETEFSLEPIRTFAFRHEDVSQPSSVFHNMTNHELKFSELMVNNTSDPFQTVRKYTHTYKHSQRTI